MNGRFYHLFYFYFCKRMNHHTQFILRKVLSRKAAVLLLSAFSVAAFATLGDGKKSSRSSKSLLSNKSGTNKSFSLKSGYTFRGSQVINSRSQSYISTKTVVSFQKGHTTYVLPLQKKVILEKVTFNPNSETRIAY